MSEEHLDDTYSLNIEAYTPDTIPMARLAEYMAALSGLMGEKDRVHFQSIKPGSTQLVCQVRQEAVYGVVKNIEDAPHVSPGNKSARAYRQLVELLRHDSAGATLERNGNNILIFPKTRAGNRPIGPFWKKTAHSGTLTRIGGRDNTAHATIQNSEGTYWSFEVNRHLARHLANYLYGEPIRLIGKAKVRRNEDGQWQEESLQADYFEVLEAMDWTTAIEKIRAVTASQWPQEAMEVLSALRTADTED